MENGLSFCHPHHAFLPIFPVVNGSTKKDGRTLGGRLKRLDVFISGVKLRSSKKVRAAKLFQCTSRCPPSLSPNFASVVGSVSENDVTNTEIREDMGDLLLREDILSKVLVHLVDSGLHECRRVCRKWYEVCNKLPVKLNIRLHRDLYFDPDQFPNSCSLKLGNDISWKCTAIENHLLPCLTKLDRITHLELSVSNWPFVHFPQKSLAALHSVRSLSVSVHTESAFLDLLKTLRCLTHLRALKLAGEKVPFGMTDTAPITEIKELRELSAQLCFLVNGENQLIFGTQTQLTRLEFLRDLSYSAVGSVSLQVISVPVCHPSDCVLL